MNRFAGVRRITTTAFVVGGLVVAVLMAVLIAPRASSSPDGLDKVAIEHGLDTGVTEHVAARSPLADYGLDGVHSSTLGTGVAGVIGIAATFAIGSGLVWVVRRSRRDEASGRPVAA